jgi:hypothetical protein
LGSAGIAALLLGRDVHAMQTKAGIERAVAAFLEEAPIARFRKYSVGVSRNVSMPQQQVLAGAELWWLD